MSSDFDLSAELELRTLENIRSSRVAVARKKANAGQRDAAAAEAVRPGADYRLDEPLMPNRPYVSLRTVAFSLRGGFLVRPLAIALLLGAAGALISQFEEQFPAVRAWVPRALFPSQADPQVAQTILATIATSTMTVVSIVFAILLMTLTLASTQFSPRILVNFVRDQVTQWTLGMFLGAFCYCIAALPAARSLPQPFAPVLTTSVAMALAPLCVGLLIYFIYHISNAISVNHIVDRVARETELVIDELMPEPRRPLQRPERPGSFPGPLDVAVASERSGYIRFIDIERLRGLAKQYGVAIRIERRVGHFVPEGATLMRLTRGDRITAERRAQLLSTVDLGPTRTLQQDVEFGVVQIVDIGLRAISPAVNDPTTAISCVDQLSSILIRWMGRVPPHSFYYDPPHVLRVAVPWIDLDGLLDLAVEQIRHYAESDAAVSLRLIRALSDMRVAVDDPEIAARLVERGRKIVAACAGQVQADDLDRLSLRLRRLEGGAFSQDSVWRPSLRASAP